MKHESIFNPEPDAAASVSIVVGFLDRVKVGLHCTVKTVDLPETPAIPRKFLEIDASQAAADTREIIPSVVNGADHNPCVSHQPSITLCPVNQIFDRLARMQPSNSIHDARHHRFALHPAGGMRHDGD